LPDRLVYPDLVPAHLHSVCLYDDLGSLIGRVRDYLTGERPPAQDVEALRNHVERFDWSEMVVRYDRRLEEIVGM